MNTPLVTILMPVYNASLFLHEAIESVLNQTFSDFEFLILDDGSIDDSIRIIKQHQDERIRLYHFEHDFIKTLNKGLCLAKGKYIARMDADDVMVSSRLQEQYLFMEQHLDVDVCGSNIRFIGNACGQTKLFLRHQDIVNYMIIANPIAHPTTMIRRFTIQKYNLSYNENYPYAEDYKFWLDISRIGRLENLPQPLLDYRISNQQVSKKKKQQQEQSAIRIRKEAIRILLNYYTALSSEYNYLKIVESELRDRLDDKEIDFCSYTHYMYELFSNISIV